MKDWLVREKFKTEIGRKTFDELLKRSDDLDWIYVVLHNCMGDENRIKFLEWLEADNPSNYEITKKIVFVE